MSIPSVGPVTTSLTQPELVPLTISVAEQECERMVFALEQTSEITQFLASHPEMVDSMGIEFILDQMTTGIDVKEDGVTSPDWPIFALAKDLSLKAAKNKCDKDDQRLVVPQPAPPPTRFTANAEIEKKLFVSLKEKAGSLIPLFGDKQLNHLGFLKLEQIIQLAWILAFIKSHQGRTCTSDESLALLQCIAKREWQLKGFHEKIVTQFSVVWQKTQVDPETQKSFKLAFSLLKQFAQCPGCYQQLWNTDSKPTIETVTYLTITFQQLSGLLVPVYEKVEKSISDHLLNIQKRIYDIYQAILGHEQTFQRTRQETWKIGADVFKKEIKVYQLVSDWLRVLLTHARIHRARIGRVQKVSSWNVEWVSCANDGREIVRSVAEIDKIVTGYLQWSALFSPTINTEEKGITFLKRVFQKECHIVPVLYNGCVEVIEKYVKQNIFKKGESDLTDVEIDKYCRIANKILDMLSDILDAQSKGVKSVKLKSVRDLKKETIPHFQEFVTEMIAACEKGCQLFLQKHLELRQQNDALCPYGANPLPHNKPKQQLKKEAYTFSILPKAQKRLDSPAKLLLMSTYTNCTITIADIQTRAASHFHFQKYLDQVHQDARSAIEARDEAERQNAVVDNLLERTNVASIPDQMTPLGSAAELLCSDLLPMLDSCKGVFKTVLDSAPAQEDDSWWFEIAEAFETPIASESEVKEVKAKQSEQQRSKKQRRKQKPKQQQKAVSAKSQPVLAPASNVLQQLEAETKLNCDVQARFVHIAGCGWGIRTLLSPKDMCGKARDILTGSKYEYLRAMHSFHLVDRMLKRCKDSASQRFLALRFMHKGYLANEQCLVATGTTPRHRLSTMMDAIGLEKGYKWDNYADCGSFVARYLGFRFKTNVDQLIQDITSDRQKWVHDAYTMQEAIFAKTSNTEVSGIREQLKAIRESKPKTPEKMSQVDSQVAKRLESLKEKAVALEKAQQGIISAMERYKKAENEIHSEMYKRLDTINRSITLLICLPNVVRDNMEPECWLEHADEALLRTHYIADNLGTYLVLLQRGVRQLDGHHYLGKFIADNQLGKDLKENQTAVLEDIRNIGKGTELPYGYSARHSKETMCHSMSLLSDLFDLSYRVVLHGKGFTPVGGRELRPDQLEAQFWKHLEDMMDLSIGLATQASR